jgi:hypothetical protein
MPTGRESMPSLLDDPPGRAVLSYRPIEYEHDPQGWAGETIYLWGVDGRWRRLSMLDLGLPDEGWPGPTCTAPGSCRLTGAGGPPMSERTCCF